MSYIFHTNTTRSNMNAINTMRAAKVIFLGLIVSVAIGACSSNADKAGENLSKEAEQFKVLRTITQTNGITDKVIFQVTGFCNIEGADLGNLPSMQILCRDFGGGIKPTYKKHYLIPGDNTPIGVTQLEGINVSEYRTKFIFRPENIVPDLDLVTGTPAPDSVGGSGDTSGTPSTGTTGP